MRIGMRRGDDPEIGKAVCRAEPRDRSCLKMIIRVKTDCNKVYFLRTNENNIAGEPIRHGFIVIYQRQISLITPGIESN